MSRRHHQESPALKPLDTGDTVTLDIDYFLRHDFADVGQAMEDLPAIIEYVNERRQVMREDLYVQKQACKRAEATAYFDLKGGRFLELYQDIKSSETAIEHAIQLDSDVIEAHRVFAILHAHAERLTTTILALQLKLEMVRSTEATRRSLVETERQED
jgi:hypothetical protein